MLIRLSARNRDITFFLNPVSKQPNFDLKYPSFSDPEPLAMERKTQENVPPIVPELWHHR
jgi:hypothetical protein